MAWWYEFSSVHCRRGHSIRGKMSAREIAGTYGYSEVSKYFDTCAEAVEYADKFFKMRPEAITEVRTEIVDKDEFGMYIANFRYFAIYHCTDGVNADRVTKVWAQPITDKMIREFNEQNG